MFARIYITKDTYLQYNYYKHTPFDIPVYYSVIIRCNIDIGAYSTNICDINILCNIYYVNTLFVTFVFHSLKYSLILLLLLKYSALYNVRCTLYVIKHILYVEQCLKHCTVYSVRRTLYV